MNTEIIKKIKNDFIALIKGVEGYCASFITEGFMRTTFGDGTPYVVKDVGIDLFKQIRKLSSLEESLNDEISENRGEINYIPFLLEMWEKIESSIEIYDNNLKPKLFENFTDDGKKIEVYPKIKSASHINSLYIISSTIGVNMPNQKIYPIKLMRSLELVYRQYRELIEPFQKTRTQSQNNNAKQDKSQQAQPIVIATFCKIVNESNIIPKGDKTIENYCREVCTAYKLPYSQRVRINFSERLKEKNIKRVETLIFPAIPNKDRQIIANHLNNKNTPEQKLYA